MESLSEQGLITLYYADESHVCSEGYVPYGWQFPDEKVFINVEKGFKLNVWGMITRENQLKFRATTHNINAQFVLQELEKLSFDINQPTYVVLDNARIHHAKIIQERVPFWQSRGLYILYLPPYSPHLNIAETLWRHLKTGWLNPIDYFNEETLAYAVNRCLANVGNHLNINFSPFNAN